MKYLTLIFLAIFLVTLTLIFVNNCDCGWLIGIWHHLAIYETLSSTPLTSLIRVVLLMVALAFFAVWALLVIFIASFLSSPPAYSSNRKITHWLALFENSPPSW